MLDVICAAVTALPEFPAPMVDPVLPERTGNRAQLELKGQPGLRAPREPRELPALKARMASRGQMELRVAAALPAQKAQLGQPARKGPKAQKAGPEIVNLPSDLLWSI